MFNNFTNHALGLFLKAVPYGLSKVESGVGQPWVDCYGDPMSNNDAFDYIMDLAENVENYVTVYKIPKHKRGEYRTIIAPNDLLLQVQKRLVKSVFNYLKPTEYAHGFVKGRGIATNATEHIGARSLGHMDIKNFFDNITAEHVTNILFGTTALCKYCNNHLDMKAGKCCPSIYKNKDGDIKYEKLCHELKWYAGITPDEYNSVVDTIVKLVTYKGKCAQGFPTSPPIANAVLRKFDIIVADRLSKYGITYTRYADDMAFSHKTESSSFLAKKVLAVVPSTLGLFRFKINKAKTYFITNKSRLSVCNVVVNKKLNIKKFDRNLLRAEVHHATVKHASRTTKAELMRLHGKVSYFQSLNPKIALKLKDQLNAFEIQRKQQTELFDEDTDPSLAGVTNEFSS